VTHRRLLAVQSLVRATRQQVPTIEACLALAVLVGGAIWAAHLHTDLGARAVAATPSEAAAAALVQNPTAGAALVRRLREGATLVDEPGQFELTGDRISFAPAKGNAKYIVLENLNLERVAQVLGQNSDARVWGVSGTIFEYRGGNYLLVTRAILKSRSRGSIATP